MLHLKKIGKSGPVLQIYTKKIVKVRLPQDMHKFETKLICSIFQSRFELNFSFVN